MAKRFQKKTVVITGASAGVGAEAARLFAAEGANLVLVARSAAPLDQIAAEFDSALCIPMDVADNAACERLFDKAVARFGAVDVLVNNAGCNYRGPAISVDVGQLAQIVDVNLRAPVVLSRLAIPFMQAAGGGAIVNVASIAGKIPVPEEAAYSATKFGLRAFSRALREELLSENIHVCCVSPGPIDTGFIMDHIDKVPDYFFSQPISSPVQVAGLVVACAADGAAERTIPVSTGMLATLGYLVPPLARVLRPLLARKGRRKKAQYAEKYRVD